MFAACNAGHHKSDDELTKPKACGTGSTGWPARLARTMHPPAVPLASLVLYPLGCNTNTEGEMATRVTCSMFGCGSPDQSSCGAQATEPAPLHWVPAATFLLIMCVVVLCGGEKLLQLLGFEHE
eukprot:65939-Pelagomonas_calceolata.AAC.8